MKDLKNITMSIINHPLILKILLELSSMILPALLLLNPNDKIDKQLKDPNNQGNSPTKAITAVDFRNTVKLTYP